MSNERVNILISVKLHGEHKQPLLLVQEFTNDLKPNQDPREKPLRMSVLVVGVLDGIISRSQTVTLDDARPDGLDLIGVTRTTDGTVVHGKNIVFREKVKELNLRLRHHLAHFERGRMEAVEIERDRYR